MLKLIDAITDGTICHVNEINEVNKECECECVLKNDKIKNQYLSILDDLQEASANIELKEIEKRNLVL